uniref:CSON007356 protein n=1 Tax=Culicoides sonorensis TaxID=179676 RepID=A0A336LWT0_CULSO
MRSELQFQIENESSLERKILEFKSNEDNMYELNKFIDEVVLDAERQAQNKTNLRESLDAANNGNNILLGLKNRKIVARARGYIRGLFEAISNCAASTSIPHLPTRKS